MRDPETDEAIPVFYPRVQKWSDHYEWQGAVVLGRTLLGQRMIEMPDLNRPLIVAIREEEMLRGRHPPIS